MPPLASCRASGAHATHSTQFLWPAQKGQQPAHHCMSERVANPKKQHRIEAGERHPLSVKSPCSLSRSES